MALEINFHRRIGLRRGFALVREKFGRATVYGLRLGWSLLTITNHQKDRHGRE